MSTEREERLAKNEAMFRIVNDRKAQWEERSTEAPELYLCECADPECREKVRLTLTEYEHVRQESRQFAVLAGHEVPEVEKVIEEHDGWLVIEKNPEVADIAQATDPRRPDKG
jgi:hypothetical protein